MLTDTLFQSTRPEQVKTKVKPVAGIRAALNNTEIWARIISFIVFYVWKMEISLFVRFSSTLVPKAAAHGRKKS